MSDLTYEYPAEVIMERARQTRAMIEENERLCKALADLILFAEEHVELSYRDADVPQMVADPILERARAAHQGAMATE